jgi:hypothetical protein
MSFNEVNENFSHLGPLFFSFKNMFQIPPFCCLFHFSQVLGPQIRILQRNVGRVSFDLVNVIGHPISWKWYLPWELGQWAFSTMVLRSTVGLIYVFARKEFRFFFFFFWVSEFRLHQSLMRLFIFISICGDFSHFLFIFSNTFFNRLFILSLLYLNILYLFFYPI